FFGLRDLGAFDLKGVRTRLRVFELEGVGTFRTRFDVSRARGLSRFVARDREMETLEAALARVLSSEAQVVGIVAEPGVGKSRLAFEFLERCRARGITIHEAHGLPHGKMTPFLPLLEILRSTFGITEQDGAGEARRKIAGTLLLLDESFREALPLLFDFLGVPDPESPPLRLDPEARQREMLAILPRITQERSHRRPAVLLFEDLHWFDAGTEVFLADLVRTVAPTRTLVLLTFRPEYRAGWMDEPHYRHLSLVPLGPEGARELLTHLLGTDRSVAALAEKIRERTAGNPFFLEETIQALVEAGHLEGARGAYRVARLADEVILPSTVQAVLAARIDR
ncbi:MAG: AAA family ATPase, partial [Candidatus Binatia bacterium]